jgi:hypothetical protein
VQHPHRHRRRRALLSAVTTAAALIAAGLTALTTTGTAAAAASRQVEKLDRGVVSVHTDSGNLVSWRWLGTDPNDVSFNVYRAGTKVNSAPITGSTNYFHSGAPAQADYTVRAVVNGVEQADSEHATQFRTGYKDVPITPPAGGTTPDGVSYTYEANDASVGDLDGDGQLDFVLKWQPTNAKDNSQSGYAGDTIVDGIKLDGTRLWRVDLGRNIRSGAHYTQFQVYDYDGDGKAEVAMKTADGTVDGTGSVIGSSSADYRNSSGYVLSGRPRVPDDVQRADRKSDAERRPRPGARHGVVLGRLVRQPGGPLPRRDGLPGRLPSVTDHGPRLLHPYGDRRLGLAGRCLRPPLDLRHRLLDQLRQGVRRPGQPPVVGRGRRRGRQGRDRVRLDGGRRQRQRAVDHQERPRRRHARG